MSLLPSPGRAALSLVLLFLLLSAFVSPSFFRVPEARAQSLVTTVPTGGTPSGELAYDSSKCEIFVGSYLGNPSNSFSVRVLSDTNDTFQGMIQLGGTSAGMAYDPTNGNVYINYLQYVGTVASLGWVAVVSDKNNSVVKNVQVGGDDGLPNHNVVYDSGRGKIFVSGGSGGTVSVISDENNSVVQTISPYFGCCGAYPVSATLGAIAYDFRDGRTVCDASRFQFRFCHLRQQHRPSPYGHSRCARPLCNRL